MRAVESNMYHVSPSRHREAIEAEGLNRPEGTYLWSDYDLARDMVEGGEGGEPYDIWEVDPGEAELEEDPNYAGGDIAYYTGDPIPPTNLRKLGSQSPYPPEFDPVVLDQIREEVQQRHDGRGGCYEIAPWVEAIYPQAKHEPGVVLDPERGEVRHDPEGAGLPSGHYHHYWNRLPDGGILDVTNRKTIPVGHPDLSKYISYSEMGPREEARPDYDWPAWERFLHERTSASMSVDSYTEKITRDLFRGCPAVPPREHKIGATTVRWWEGKPGDAVVMAEGGSPDDRYLAEQIVAIQLEGVGYRRARFTFDSQRKTAGWPDIMQKAKRLIQGGQVTILRNGYNNIVGHVIGDHGEYTTEIGREDPESRTITTWQCECPWDQYAWQRTRKWKKYEGRPCAHVMALYWKSLATPLDDYDPEQHGPMGTGQKLGPPPGGGTPPAGGGGGSRPPGGQTPGPSPTPTPSPVEAPSPAGLVPPGEPGILPKPPLDQLAEQVPPVPGQTPAGMPANPNIVSVPGAKLPSPFNPIQFPGGTYSRVSSSVYHLAPSNVRSLIESQGLRTDRPSFWPEMDENDPGVYVWKTPGEAKKWEQWVTEQGIEGPHDIWEIDHEGLPIGIDEMEPNSYVIPQNIEPTRLRRVSQVSDQFVAPEIVRLKDEAYGLAEGKSEEHGAGQYQAIPAGSTGEVLGQDPTTGWVEVIFPLEGGELTPYHVKVFCEPTDIEHTRQRPPGPFIKRR